MEPATCTQDEEAFHAKNKKWFRDMCEHALGKLRALPLPDIPQTSPNEIVFVEHRSEMPHLEALIRNAALLLGHSWCITVVGGKHTNAAFVTDMCSAIHPNIRVVLVDTPTIQSKKQYKKWIRTLECWSQCVQPTTQTVLLCAEDSLLLKPIPAATLTPTATAVSLGDDGFCFCSCSNTNNANTNNNNNNQIGTSMISFLRKTKQLASPQSPPFVSHSHFDPSAVGMHSWWRGCKNKMWTFAIEAHWLQLMPRFTPVVSLPYAAPAPTKRIQTQYPLVSSSIISSSVVAPKPKRAHVVEQKHHHPQQQKEASCRAVLLRKQFSGNAAGNGSSSKPTSTTPILRRRVGALSDTTSSK